MALCAQNFELLPILKDTPEGQLLHNTIYAGVWSKYALDVYKRQAFGYLWHKHEGRQHRQDF